MILVRINLSSASFLSLWLENTASCYFHPVPTTLLFWGDRHVKVSEMVRKLDLGDAEVKTFFCYSQ